MDTHTKGHSGLYLDNAATTELDPQVKREMDNCFKIFANPSSTHELGQHAKKMLDSARESVAKILNCEPAEIIFTAGGTESINLAIQGIARAQKQKGRHIITSKIEHPAVLQTCKYLREEGFTITYLDVDSQGLLDLKQLENSVTKETILITIMYANNEIGTVQPIAEAAKIANKNNICFHTDACQAAGELELDVQKLGADLMTINGSKICGPKGSGILFVRKNVELRPIIFGGGQEKGLRSGTENLPAIVGFAKALEIAQARKKSETKKMIRLRDDLIKQITQKIPNAVINGHPTKRLANNVSVSLPNIDGDAIVDLLSEQKIYVSSGSACTSQNIEPSHVLRAIGLNEETANGTIRITLGKQTKQKDIDRFVNALVKIIKKLNE